MWLCVNDGWPDIDPPERPHPDDTFWKRRKKRKLFALLIVLIAPIDLASYCKGYCSTRYQDGIERNGQCFCGDYYPINLENRIAPLRQPRRPVFGTIPDARTALEPYAPEPSWENHY